jgi:hypothetical protein
MLKDGVHLHKNENKKLEEKLEIHLKKGSLRILPLNSIRFPNIFLTINKVKE